MNSLPASIDTLSLTYTLGCASMFTQPATSANEIDHVTRGAIR